MANKVRGTSTIVAGDRRLVLQFTNNAMCELEGVAGKSVTRFLSDLAQGAASGDLPMVAVRQLLWAGLVEHQPDLTLRDAGQIIDDMGGVQVAMESLSAAVALAFPDAKGAPAGNVAGTAV